MEKRLYLKADLIKSKEQTGEHVGGKYVARVQTGVEKDGSPQYRYFRSQNDYNEYLRRERGKKKEGKGQGPAKKEGPKTGGKQGNRRTMKERLQSKLKKEKEQGASKKKRSLFGKGQLYLGETNE